MYKSSNDSIAQTLFINNTPTLNRGLHVSQKLNEDIHGFTHKNVRRMKERQVDVQSIEIKDALLKLHFSLEVHV